ncbi:MAG: nucleotidyltransferase family protein [Candidatus Krumholzibacteriia bacterium]
MIEGVVLAAGRSRRAGVFKPAYRHEGRPLLAHAVATLAACCERVVVVAGHRQAEVADLLAAGPRTTLVVNAHHDRGMFSSVQAGVAALTPGLRGFFVLPADCPFVETEVTATMLRTFEEQDAARVVVPEHGGRGGHPVLLPGRARSVIGTAAAGATLRDVIRSLGAVRVPVAQPSVLMDIDTRAELRALTEERQV